MFAILALIGALAALVGTFSVEIAALHPFVQGSIYIIAGLVWIAPLKPLLRWMETGRFRDPRT